jgi:hypothetical protein
MNYLMFTLITCETSLESSKVEVEGKDILSHEGDGKICPQFFME